MRDHHNKARFVILTSPRSGSTWLVSLLNQVDGISSFGELFLPRKREEGEFRWDADFPYPRFVESSQAATGLRPLSVFSYLDTLYQQPGTVGFKLMYSQFRSFPEILLYFIAHRFRVIHLIRKNPLDQIISQAVTRKLEQAHRFANHKSAERVQVELNTHTLIRQLEARQRVIKNTDRLLRLTGLSVLEVGYEDLQKDASSFQKICSFLSITFFESMPESRFVKIRRESQAEVLKNYVEVRQKLGETPFIRYME